MVVHERSAPGGGGARPALSLRTIIDPSAVGNVGRYLNHSCRPNLRHCAVRAGAAVPRLAFFCARDVRPGEELAFFYGEPQQQREGEAAPGTRGGAVGRRRCCCGEAECQGYLPCDSEFGEGT